MDQQNYLLADRSDTQSNQGSSNEEEDLPDEFICGICRDIYLDPRKLIPCHHVFCETCLRRLNQAQISKCPICSSGVPGYPSTRLPEGTRPFVNYLEPTFEI